MADFMNKIYLGNAIWEYARFLIIFAAGALCILLFKQVLLRRLSVWAQKTATTLDDFIVRLIKKILLPLLYFGVFYFSIGTLELNPFVSKSMTTLGIAILTFCIARMITEFLGYGFGIYSAMRGKGETMERSLAGIRNVAKFLIWSLALIFLLDNMGFKISTVIAGLGIGGIAVGLAAQAVLRDIFSYFSILFDRPFDLGDFIIIGDYMGVVEHIGIKTTRIRSLGGEQVIFSNTDLTDSRVRNYKRMAQRRVIFKFGVIYATTAQQLKKIPSIIKEGIEGIADAKFDRAHFFSFGDFSLDFEVVFYITGSDYNKYMDIQQQINFAIKEGLEKHGIEFAYPTQTVYVNKA